MSGNNAGRQDGDQGKKVPSSLKKVVALIIIVLCVWGYTRWSGKDAEIGNRIDALLSDKSGDGASSGAGEPSTGNGSGGLGRDALGDGSFGGSRQPSLPGENPGLPGVPPDPFMRSSAENSAKPPLAFDPPRFDSSATSAPGDELPTESASAQPKSRGPERAPERTAVLPPSAAPGHLGNTAPDSVPPAVLEVGATLSPVKEDHVVLPAFIRDLARVMAQAYYPAGSHPNAGKNGISVLTLKGLNMRYGLGFHGFNVSSGNPRNARRAIFTYIMNPAMLDGLYGLYADSLVSELSQEADQLTRNVRGNKRSLTPEEKADMFKLYARRARALSSALAASCEPGVEQRINAYQDAARAVERANIAYADATMEHEAAVMDGKNVKAALEKKERTGAAYQRAMQQRNAARKNLLSFARKAARDSDLSDDTLLYALSWGQRRLRSGANTRECVRTMARILNNLATRFDKRAEGFR